MSGIEDEVRRTLASFEAVRSGLGPAERLAKVAVLRGELASAPSSLFVRLDIAEATALAELGQDDAALMVLRESALQQDWGDDQSTLKAVAYATVMAAELSLSSGAFEALPRYGEGMARIFRRLPPGKVRQETGMMMADLAFLLLAAEVRPGVLEIALALESLTSTPHREERTLIAIGTLYRLLVDVQTGELGGLRETVELFGQFGEPGLEALDRVEPLFGEASLNPAFHGLLELLRAAVYIQLRRRTDALSAAARAKDAFRGAGLSPAHALASALHRSLTEGE